MPAGLIQRTRQNRHDTEIRDYCPGTSKRPRPASPGSNPKRIATLKKGGKGVIVSEDKIARTYQIEVNGNVVPYSIFDIKSIGTLR